jgi:hypothetical protein
MHLAPRVLEDAIHALEQPAPWQICGRDQASGDVLQLKNPELFLIPGFLRVTPPGLEPGFSA